MRGPVTFSLALFLVAACGDTDRPLRDLQAAGGGPDEFAVIPQEPLEIPAQLTLPTPTPGGTNLADPMPNADAIVALGGAPNAQFAGGVPAGDAALVAQASRYGTDPAIRATLAAEDEATLERARLTNVFNPLNRDRYFPAYSRQALDAYAELERLRGLGVTVPVAPVAAQTVPADAPHEICADVVGEDGSFVDRVCLPQDTDPS
ncbi:DUF3035 domain-containing protein [Yoonia sp. BS5-3]|uniref:DUF3035 domain-containing protein n=1 Tax=Yoonia phaeophyticola TaxID=3137369 RepID=A0ABZ2V597_9RHOB